MEKICKNCNGEFESGIYFKRFCSEKCRLDFWKIENKNGREFIANLYNAKKIYKQSNSIEEALSKLNQKDKDYLAESISFLMFLYPDKNIATIFDLIKQETK